jgi:hypothetical protein
MNNDEIWEDVNKGFTVALAIFGVLLVVAVAALVGAFLHGAA